jgi:hypothetical protein
LKIFIPRPGKHFAQAFVIDLTTPSSNLQKPCANYIYRNFTKRTLARAVLFPAFPFFAHHHVARRVPNAERFPEQSPGSLHTEVFVRLSRAPWTTPTETTVAVAVPEPGDAINPQGEKTGQVQRQAMAGDQLWVAGVELA